MERNSALQYEPVTANTETCMASRLVALQPLALPYPLRTVPALTAYDSSLVQELAPCLHIFNFSSRKSFRASQSRPSHRSSVLRLMLLDLIYTLTEEAHESPAVVLGALPASQAGVGFLLNNCWVPD
jgi:hypothetical protein